MEERATERGRQGAGRERYVLKQENAMSQTADATEQARWRSPTSELPDDDQRVEWIDPDGVTEHGTYWCRVWILSDNMYVYYLPILWRPL